MATELSTESQQLARLPELLLLLLKPFCDCWLWCAETAHLWAEAVKIILPCSSTGSLVSES